MALNSDIPQKNTATRPAPPTSLFSLVSLFLLSRSICFYRFVFFYSSIRSLHFARASLTHAHAMNVYNTRIHSGDRQTGSSSRFGLHINTNLQIMSLMCLHIMDASTIKIHKIVCNLKMYLWYYYYFFSHITELIIEIPFAGCIRNFIGEWQKNWQPSFEQKNIYKLCRR